MWRAFFHSRSLRHQKLLWLADIFPLRGWFFPQSRPQSLVQNWCKNPRALDYYVERQKFHPVNLKSKLFSLIIGRGNEIVFAFPFLANAEIFGPPGYSNPNNFATLSKHSPAASSRVAPNFSYTPWSVASNNSVCPPLTSKHSAGNSMLWFSILIFAPDLFI